MLRYKTEKLNFLNAGMKFVIKTNFSKIFVIFFLLFFFENLILISSSMISFSKKNIKHEAKKKIKSKVNFLFIFHVFNILILFLFFSKRSCHLTLFLISISIFIIFFCFAFCHLTFIPNLQNKNINFFLFFLPYLVRYRISRLSYQISAHS